ncbi:hypothetical protein METP3_01004 [Methanosarcinales archaeon]|nr:hypothetical protein METP3_01004 [Methanosarcinales archaeon]
MKSLKVKFKFTQNKIRYHITYKPEETQMLKALRISRTLKEKAGWSREIGSGFIAEDIFQF